MVDLFALVVISYFLFFVFCEIARVVVALRTWQLQGPRPQGLDLSEGFQISSVSFPDGPVKAPKTTQSKLILVGGVSVSFSDGPGVGNIRLLVTPT